MRELDCRGAPRDLGLAQGEALREEIRAALGVDGGGLQGIRARLAWLRPDPVAARVWRDLRRYFPHQAEWLDGMSLASGAPLRALARALARRALDPSQRAPALGVAHEGASRLARPLPGGLVLRRVAPEGRFGSVELCRPAEPAPLLGVNEAGLAVAVVGAPAHPGAVAAPLACFARDCLERFESAEAALAWCLARPAAGGGGILLADATELVGVAADGSRRRALRASEGWLAAPEALRPSKPPARGADLDGALCAALAAAAPGAGSVALLDPVARSLRVGERAWSAPASDATPAAS